MSSKKMLISCVLLFFAAGFVAAAQNETIFSTIRGDHARMTIVTKTPASFTATNINEAGLVTIFNSLASAYPKGEYWCCEGYNVMGSNSGAGEQWMAAPFTPSANHTLTRIVVAAGYSQQGTNGIVISINDDSNGEPGQVLQSWNATNLPTFGSCCALVAKSDNPGISITAGKQYWIVLSTNSSEVDTVDAWNVADADQVDAATMASFSNGQWHVFQATPGLAFAVQGSN